MPSSRQLATILFADIVSYTATMQRDELLARQQLQKFRQVLQAKTPLFGGRIVQFYGDGCLIVFNSSVEAVGCAKTLQEFFRQEPSVPVRIGLDSGDVFFEADNVYGDSVNTASRIESIGVAGSVLCSDRVRRHLGNQPDFNLVSIGMIDFKNVVEPIEIFALANEGFAVPQRNELAGKLKEASKTNTPGRYARKLIPVLAVLLIAIGTFGIWALRSWTTSKKILPNEIRDERVAVAIFNNFTNDNELEALGYLASEWLTAGLREVGVKTVSPETVREYKDYIGILPGNPEGKAAFSEITKARYLVTGSYFAEGDSIRLMSRLVSTETGEDVHIFPAIFGSKRKKEALVEDMYQRLLGYWATKRDFRMLPLPQSPPKYDAYKVFLNCRPPGLCYGEAFQLDSTFMLAGILSLLSDQVFGWDTAYFQKMDYLRNNWGNLTNFERDLLNFISFLEEGDHEAAVQAIEAIYQLDSTNLLIINESAFNLAFGTKQVELGLERFERPIREFDVHKDQLWDNFFLGYLQSLNILEKYDEVIQFFEKTPKEYMQNKLGSSHWLELVVALLKKGEVDQAVNLIKDSDEKNDYWNKEYMLMGAAYLYAAIYPDSAENPFLPYLRNNLERYEDPSFTWTTIVSFTNFRSKAMAYYLLGELERSEEIFLSLRGFDWGNYLKKNLEIINPQIFDYILPIWVEERLGCIYARQGRREMALAQIGAIEKLKVKEPLLLHPFFKGAASFAEGQIYSLLGEKELAIQHLQQARSEGRMIGNNTWTYTFDMDLAPLKGYSPFEELIRPVKGRVGKN